MSADQVKCGLITGFLSTTKDRFNEYNESKSLNQRLELVSQMEGVDGVELVHPYEVKDADALKKLMDYSWQGNIRELENAVEHAVLVAQSPVITWNDLPTNLKERYQEEKNGKHPSETIEKVRREREESSQKLYREAINQTGGNVAKAAHNLGMSRATLYRRLKKYGLTDEISKSRRNIKNDTAE